MPNYNNNYGNYNNGVYGTNYIQPTNGNAGQMNNNYNNFNSYGLTQQQIVQYFQQGRLEWSDFVHGRAGAEAYQLPPGVNMVKLWDDETNRFYVKGYDNNGRPRVLADSDFTEHVEPEPVAQQNIDLSAYATKEDIQAMITNALSNIQLPNVNSFVTKNDLDTALAGLSVGNGGRIVRSNEYDA